MREMTYLSKARILGCQTKSMQKGLVIHYRKVRTILKIDHHLLLERERKALSLLTLKSNR